ncbi:MAG: WYL domain-containing protein [Gemmatimonadales bacterium]
MAKLPGDDPADSLRTASLAPAGDPEHLRRLRAAFRGRRKVRLGYRKPAEERAEARVICPYAIVFASGMWYVVAHWETSEGIRFFRLDRIDSVEPLETRFPAPRDFSVDEVLREGRVFRAQAAGTLRVRYSPRIARWIADREGKTLAADESLTLEHPLADLDWAVRHLLQYGPDVEVLEPAEVREAIVRRLADIAQ